MSCWILLANKLPGWMWLAIEFWTFDNYVSLEYVVFWLTGWAAVQAISFGVVQPRHQAAAYRHIHNLTYYVCMSEHEKWPAGGVVCTTHFCKVWFLVDWWLNSLVGFDVCTLGLCWFTCYRKCVQPCCGCSSDNLFLIDWFNLYFTKFKLNQSIKNMSTNQHANCYK